MSKRRNGQRASVSPVAPHSNERTHAMVMAWLRQASSTDIMKLSVRAGIYDERGNLLPPYKTPR